MQRTNIWWGTLFIPGSDLSRIPHFTRTPIIPPCATLHPLACTCHAPANRWQTTGAGWAGRPARRREWRSTSICSSNPPWGSWWGRGGISGSPTSPYIRRKGDKRESARLPSPTCITFQNKISARQRHQWQDLYLTVQFLFLSLTEKEPMKTHIIPNQIFLPSLLYSLMKSFMSDP